MPTITPRKAARVKLPSRGGRKCPPFESQVRRTIRKFGLLEADEHVLVAVSGGPDSTAMLLALHRIAAGLRTQLTVAHLNHQIRGKEADEDEKFVRDLSNKLAIPFVSESIEVLSKATAAKKNLEEAAREARRDFLHRLALRVRADRIAVGHTMNDQAETILMRLFRGSGIEGLSAIHPIVDSLFIRPLLECRRLEVLEYLRSERVSYRQDSTNSEMRFQRNRIRHELIPYLEGRFNPKLIDSLSRQADMFRELLDYLEIQCQERVRHLVCAVPEGISIRAKDLLKAHPTLQKLILRRALRECRGSLRGITARHISDLLALCLPGQSGHRLSLPGKTLAFRQFEILVLSMLRQDPVPSFSYELEVPGSVYVREAGLEFRAAVRARVDTDVKSVRFDERAVIDASSSPRTLTIRSRLPGDRYGSVRSKKVKKVLIDSRIPVKSRSALPMVATGNVVVWIPGFRPAKSVIAHSKSDRCIILEAFTADTRRK